MLFLRWTPIQTGELAETKEKEGQTTDPPSSFLGACLLGLGRSQPRVHLLDSIVVFGDGAVDLEVLLVRQ